MYIPFSFKRNKCPNDMSEVPHFLPLAQLQLRPEKQIVSVFVDIARDDGYVYAEDLPKVVRMIFANTEMKIYLFALDSKI